MPSKEIKPYKLLKNQMDAEDINTSIDLIVHANKNLGGRPCKYENTTQGLDAFKKNCIGYFEYVYSVNSKVEDKQRMIADIEGLCVYCGISRNTLSLYSKRSPEWQEVIEMFKTQICYEKKQLALKGRIPPVLAVFDLANNHQYRNTNTFNNESAGALSEEDAQLEDDMRTQGLVWNPVSKEWEPE